MNILPKQKLPRRAAGSGGVLLWVNAPRRPALGGSSIIQLILRAMLYAHYALTNALAFRQMQRPHKRTSADSSSGLRVGSLPIGTLIDKVWTSCPGLQGSKRHRQPHSPGGDLSIVMGIYSLTLPHTPPLRGAAWLQAAQHFPTPKLYGLFKGPQLFDFCGWFSFPDLLFHCSSIPLHESLPEKSISDADFKIDVRAWSELLFMLALPWGFQAHRR